MSREALGAGHCTGEVVISCNVTALAHDGTVSRGSAQLTVNLSGPPVCGRPDGCLRLPRASAELPNTRFVAQATGFSGDEPLRYEFGFVLGRDTAVVQPASRSSATTMYADNGPGTYTVYCVAISENGGKSEMSTADFELTLPSVFGAAFTSELLARIQGIDFSLLARTGDFGPVIGGVLELNSYINPLSQQTNGSGSEDEEGGGRGPGPNFRRALLQANPSAQADEPISDALAELQTIVDNEESGVPEALDVLSSLRSMFSSRDPTVAHACALGQIVQDAMEILIDSGSCTIGLSTIGSSLGSAGMAAEVLTGTEDPWENFSRLQETIGFARRVIEREAPAGYRSYANSTELGVGVSRNTMRETSKANVEVDGVLAFGRDTPVPIRMFMPTESQAPFRQWCAGNAACNSTDILTLYFTYIRDYTLLRPSNLDQTVRDHFNHDDIDPVPVSGILETQFMGFKSEDAAICDAQRTENCAMDLTIPVIPEGVNGVPSFSGRNLACVRLRPREGEQGFAAEVIQDGIRYNALSSSAVCRTKVLGRHLLVSYNVPPGPPLSPTSPPSPPLPPSAPGRAGGGEPTSICESKDARVETRVAFSLDFESHNTADFERDVQDNLQRNLLQRFPTFFSFNGPDQCPSFVTVLSLSPGSVIVDLSIELGSSKSAADAQKLKDELEGLDANEAKALFDAELQNNLEERAFSAESPAGQQPGGDGEGDDRGGDAKVLGPAIAIPVFFFLLAVAGVAYFAYKHSRFGVTYLNRRDGRESPEPV